MKPKLSSMEIIICVIVILTIVAILTPIFYLAWSSF